MSYEVAEQQLSSRTITKSAIGRLPVKALSEWCTTQGIVVIPTGKRAGSAVKCDYVEAICKFVRRLSFCGTKLPWNSSQHDRL